ncbi:MAG TPA: carbamate kinase [Candidatus Kryptonia bacterium]|nr:carbamate kinase [Candidatus Kryptonia bacterium]
MSSPPSPLIVVALGGNAISPPRGDLSLAVEQLAIANAVAEISALARAGARLLLVHGNGPQVGRLLAAPGLGDVARLDVHVAQTQGEIGYLLATALDAQLGDHASVALVTRVVVDAADPAFAAPTKPVGAVLAHKPDGLAAVLAPDGSGWRRVVASPRPLAVLEQAAIATLLVAHHVIAGGGGGVALAHSGNAYIPQPAVVDKDYVAALLAVALDAAQLLFVTDVAHAFDRFGDRTQQPIDRMSIAQARVRLAGGAFAPGSMAPKIESAVQFVSATRRPALITTLGAVAAACRGQSGTIIEP